MRLTATFWRTLDARVQRQLRGVGRPVRGVVRSLTADGLALTGRLLARYGEDLDQVEVAQHYGFSSAAPADVEVIAVPVGGSSAHLVVVGELDRTGARPADLASGEAAIYSSGGAKVVLRANGDVEIQPGDGGKVYVAGGGAAAARVGDTVAPGAGLATWLSAAATALQSLAGVPLPTSTSSSISTGSALTEIG